MEEKKINPDREQEPAAQPEEVKNEAPAEETADKVEQKKEKKTKKAAKPKKLRNQALLRRGSYAVAITAAVLAGILALNILVNVLAKRVTLEFDMSTDKENSMSEENVAYLRALDKEVTLTMCAKEEDYSENGYMAYYAQQYGVSSDASEYYKQTLTLLKKYPNYNSKITLWFVDTQSTEFTEISTKYANVKPSYGDILVTSGEGDRERYKVVGFEDIYAMSEDSTYAAYGYTTSEISGNNLETAVTGAIEYVTSSKLKKAAVYTGHSATDATADYQKLLTTNNYEITVIEDALLTAIPEEVDAVVIAAPTKDFIASELNVLSEFLDNNDQLGKGLLFFADASAPYLPDFYAFLEEWGIAVEEGILFETNSGNHIDGDPTTMGLYPTEEETDLTSGMQVCITGYNVPL
ncbi:MAG: GldG family protein, partial [Clostridia bacterium]|nr:GldG family protein [Clostridia bacterium]